jgi:hypothetical protein
MCCWRLCLIAVVLVNLAACCARTSSYSKSAIKPRVVAEQAKPAQAIAAWEELPSGQWFFSNESRANYNIG